MATNPYQKYQQTSINTATPAELTMMLYNGCLKFISIAKQAIEQGEVAKRNENMQKAQNIIQEFMVTLNQEVELSSDLLRIYDYVWRTLVDANTRNDLTALKEAESIIMDLRNTWKEMMLEQKKPQMVGSEQS
ncbi:MULTISPECIES: flagellar export chaperone FliS [Cytobacillus]|uniref:Flagellar secretion chaperone FliS n=1 Tax=Cytobacillus stercorigallinarum TaxID=2762240 RepID=A0ABR8QNH8_9BACI|nr:flagellar export chaperone FliS [Cytobacillus stercorigallinarum]MBD7937098.1 flagellar export chaperone FliS [Cytobacillus stercorigallinarum]